MYFCDCSLRYMLIWKPMIKFCENGGVIDILLIVRNLIINNYVDKKLIWFKYLTM